LRSARVRFVAGFGRAKSNPIAKAQHRFRDWDAVDVCAIGRIEIFQPVSFAGQLQLRVMSRDRWIVNGYRVVRATPNRDQIFDEFMRSPLITSFGILSPLT